MEYIVAILAIIGILMAKLFYDSKRTKERVLDAIHTRWGTLPDRELTSGQLAAIRTYYDAVKRPNLDIDDTTWNDISMDEIYALINNTSCTIGEEYLYAMLRMPAMDTETLEERESLIRYYQEQDEERIELQKALYQMGKLRSVSYYQEIHHVTEFAQEKKIHIAYCFALILSFMGIILSGITGVGLKYTILFMVACVSNNVITYFRRKSEIEKYFTVLSHTTRLLYSVDLLLAMKSSQLKPYESTLQSIKKKFASFRKKAKFVASGNNMSGDLSDVFFDYIRMLFHIDLIFFDKLVKELEAKEQDIREAYEIIGKLDSSIAIASYRTYLEGDYCIPKLYQQAKPKLSAVDMYHPLIDDPVKNSIHEARGVLITGSNASGKSTFIKTVAINAILAQTIHTCTCQSYEASFFKVYSSMALTDNLLGNESYYIVEIKSLKRIIDQNNQRIPTLCFVDEVLRGTNTLERIAASSRILKYLAELNTLCFAATHDIELTYILEKTFANYHFEEEVKEDQVVFNYELRTGRATTRNAIKLLKMMGYPDKVIKDASNEVTHFMETGTWNAYY